MGVVDSVSTSHVSGVLDEVHGDVCKVPRHSELHITSHGRIVDTVSTSHIFSVLDEVHGDFAENLGGGHLVTQLDQVLGGQTSDPQHARVALSDPQLSFDH